MDQEFYKVSDVARILNVCPRTVIYMLQTGKLVGLEIAGKKRKTYRILKGEIDRFISEEYEKTLKKLKPIIGE